MGTIWISSPTRRFQIGEQLAGADGAPFVAVVMADAPEGLRAALAAELSLAWPAAQSWDSLNDRLTDLDERVVGVQRPVVVVLIVNDDSQIDEVRTAVEALKSAAEFWEDPSKTGSDGSPRQFHTHIHATSDLIAQRLRAALSGP